VSTAGATRKSEPQLSVPDSSQAVKETRRTTIPFCRVLWSNHTEREATWEKEADLRKEYPHLFTEEVEDKISRTRFSVVGENVTTQEFRCANFAKI
jgi:hypothetical protein